MAARKTKKPPSIRSVRCLFRADPEHHGVGEWVFWSPDGDAEDALRAWIGDGLPKLARRRVELIVPTEDPEDGDPLWTLATITVKTLPLQLGLLLLSRVETGSNAPGAVPPSDAIAAWSHATKFALELLAAGRFLPTLEDSDDPELWAATWGVVLARDEDRDRFRQLARAMPPCGHAWPFEEEDWDEEADEEEDEEVDVESEEDEEEYEDDDDDDEEENERKARSKARLATSRDSPPPPTCSASSSTSVPTP